MNMLLFLGVGLVVFGGVVVVRSRVGVGRTKKVDVIPATLEDSYAYMQMMDAEVDAAEAADPEGKELPQWFHDQFPELV